VLFHTLSQYLSSWAFVSYELRHNAGSGWVEDARRAVASLNPDLPIFRARTLRAQAEKGLLRERLLAALSICFGGLALLLACIGLYGLLAYAVTRRTGEIGIRMALGAQRGHVVWLVLRESLLLIAGGAAGGVPLALWSARYAKTMLFGVEPSDPLVLASTVAILVAVGAFAGYLPARRAARVDPIAALRSE
jgi:ABC-type antimicrobial peptide transport system permease subunit